MVQKVVKIEAELPGEMSDLERLMQEHAGAGVSNRSEDNLVPQISVLQSQSPEVIPGPSQIDGAHPGDFLIVGKVIPGRDGFWFQPCYVDHTWLEFTPIDRGGGFVAQHEFRGVDNSGNALPPPTAIATGKMRFKMPNGNEVMHYRQLAGILWTAEAGQSQGLEHVISFKSTGHTTMREWNTKAGQQRFPNGDQYPLFACVYKVTSSPRRNSSGQWYAINVGDPINLNSKEAAAIVGNGMKAFNMGLALNKAFASREKRAGQVSAEQAGEASDTAPL